MPWYRTIVPKTEIAVLAVRERLSDEELQAQRVRCPQGFDRYKDINGKDPSNFTTLSAFQYLKNGVPQYLFTGFNGDENIGVMLKCYSDMPRKVYWRDSLRCEVSDDTFKQYHTEQDFQKALSNQGFIRTTEDKVSKSVVKRYQNSVQWCNENEVDIEQAGIGWTEGLFRYKWNEIDGIVVNPENTQSCLQGAAFSVLVEQNTGTRCNFYTWDKEKASFVAVSRDTIAEVISSSKHQLKELYKQYVACQDKLQTQQYI